MTARAVRDEVQNVLDFLVEAELAIYANPVLMSPDRVSFHVHKPHEQFLTTRGHPDVDQFVQWIASGAYSAVLLDGSVLQITYSLGDGDIVGHRLMYAPCPFDLDAELLLSGDGIADIVDLYRGGETILRSPIRFDYDPEAAKSDHPASHFTFNGVDCRIPCVAPLHVLRFVDFIFRNFYPRLHFAHKSFFSASAWKHAGEPVPMSDQVGNIHLMWDARANQTSVG